MIAKSAAPIIDSFIDLPKGWHYGEGRNATETAATMAKKVDSFFTGTEKFRVIEVFPYIDGGIVMSGFYQDYDNISITCKPDSNLVDLCHEVNDEIIYEKENLTFEDACVYVKGKIESN